MKLNRPPRTWSAANAAAAARPNSEFETDAETSYELGALGDALGAYVTGQSEAPVVVEEALMGFMPDDAVRDDALEVGVVAREDLAQTMTAIDREPLGMSVAHAAPNVVAINSAQEAKETVMTVSSELVASPTVNVDALVSRLNRTRTSIADALAYCGDAADEIMATAASFTAAAAQMRAVAIEQQELDALIAGAVNDLVALNDSIAAHETESVNQAAALLAETAREAEELRAAAVTDVERARERLLQFTTEIGNVAIELQGGTANERRQGQRIA